MLLDTKLGDTLRRVQRLNFGTIWLKVFSDRALQIKVLNWIRQDQLFKEGIDENNQIIGLYSIATESINPSKKAGTPFTLFDSGEFYKSFFIAVSKNDFTILLGRGALVKRTYCFFSLVICSKTSIAFL